MYYKQKVHANCSDYENERSGLYLYDVKSFLSPYESTIRNER